MTGLADLLGSISTLLWVVFACVVAIVLRRVLTSGSGPLTKFGLGPSGVTFEFAESKLDLAAAKQGNASEATGMVSKRSIIERMQRNSDILGRARILWVDDHPENNVPVVELLRQYGAGVDTPRSNEEALILMADSRYDAVISDVSRDAEGNNSEIKGLELAEQIHNRWGIQPILFTTHFNPATFPDLTSEQRLDLVRQVQRNVFAVSNRLDGVLHYVLDCLER